MILLKIVLCFVWIFAVGFSISIFESVFERSLGRGRSRLVAGLTALTAALLFWEASNCTFLLLPSYRALSLSSFLLGGVVQFLCGGLCLGFTATRTPPPGGWGESIAGI